MTCPGHRQHCHTVVVDNATGAQRTLPGPALPHTPLTPWPPGIIAPDGAAAAVLELGRDSQLSVHLLDLRSGANRLLSLPISENEGQRAMPGPRTAGGCSW